MKEEDNLIQATDPRGLPQCDQLHSESPQSQTERAWKAAESIMAEFRDDPDGVSVNYVAAVIYDLLRKATLSSAVRIEALETALAPFANYAAKREAMPLNNLGDCVHTIHACTEFEATITFTDCRRARLAYEARAAPKPSEGDIVGPE